MTVACAKTRLARGLWPEKTAYILPRHNWFPREMMSEKRAQKCHNDDASLPRSGQCFRLAEANFPRGTTNQKHYLDLGTGSDASTIWNFCTRFSTSFRGETSGDIAKRQLFSQAKTVQYIPGGF